MIVGSRQGGVGPRRLAALLACFGAIGLGAVLGPAEAPVSAVAQLVVEQSTPGDTLIGRTVPVELTVSNPGDQTANNLLLAVRLRPGVNVSSSDTPPTGVVEETDAAGNLVSTVVSWSNIVDIRPGGVFHYDFRLSYDMGDGVDLYAVGDLVEFDVYAIACSPESAVQPNVVVSGSTNPVTAVFVDGSGSTLPVDGAGVPQPIPGTVVSNTSGESLLVPVLLTKSEPSTEGELLRGVHDHQTVYTISIESGSEGAVEFTTVDDWIPAGLEFLGCGLDDNSSAEEYPGAGPLNPGHAPAVTNCVDPVVVETVLLPDPARPEAPAGLTGVFTHVVWAASDLDPAGAGSLPQDTTFEFDYVAGIPQRANTVDWGSTPSRRSTEHKVPTSTTTLGPSRRRSGRATATPTSSTRTRRSTAP